MRQIIIICIGISATLSGFSQNTVSNNWRYSSLTQGGALVGSSGVNYSVQTIQGMRNQQWFVGLGIGIDHYGVPGFPLVFHGQKYLFAKKSKPYIYAQSGIQIPWYKDNNSANWSDKNSYDLKTGFLAEMGIGYAIKAGKKNSINFSAGYSYKTVNTNEILWPIYITVWPIPESVKTIYQNKYHFQRIAVKIGFQF